MTTERRIVVGDLRALPAGATRVRWTHVAPTLVVVWIVSMFDKSNMAIVINDPAFLDELSLRGQQAKLGWLSTGLFLAYGLSAPLWGFGVDRIGARRAGALSLLVWAISCFWSGVATSYDELLWSRVLLGVGEAALYPVTLSVVTRWFAPEERGRATSTWWIGVLLGPTLAGLVITSLVLAVGWRAQFHAMGVLALALPLPMVWLLVRDRPHEHPSASAAEAELVTRGALEEDRGAPDRAPGAAGSAWVNHRFWLVTLAICSNGVFFWGWSSWLPTYLRTARGLSFSTSGYLTFVIFGVAAGTTLLFGRLSDRVLRRAPFSCVGGLLAALFMVAVAFAPDATTSVVSIVCALCAQQVGVSSAEILMHSVVRASQMGKTQGVRAFMTQVFGAAAPLITGYVLQRTGGFAGVFAVLALSMVVAAGCMLALAREGL